MMISIISHRGFWKQKIERNKEISFKRSWKNGFGLEIDIRDFQGNLVISHDIGNSDSINLEVFFHWYVEFGNESPLALNIKSDGLSILLREVLNKFKIENYFVFDMSVPDTKIYLDHQMKTYSRQSEQEQSPIFYNDVCGIWLDAFDGEWYSLELIQAHLNLKKAIAIVSPELHGRDHLSLWHWIKLKNLHRMENILLCTDFPTDAKLFFYE
jgi:hypothetical protein